MGEFIDREKLSDSDKLRLHAATMALLKALEGLLKETKNNIMPNSLSGIINSAKQSHTSD